MVYNTTQKAGDDVEPLIREKSYTIEDIYALPDGERAELVDGRIYYMAPPNTEHQRMVHFFDREIGNYIQNHQGECEVFPAPFAVFLDQDGQNYVEPDISVICEKNKVTERGCNGAPDWVIEIVSPGSRAMDYFTKLFKYRTAGVREYWIVDPAKRRVTVYFLDKESVEEYSFGTDIPVGIYEGYTITVM